MEAVRTADRGTAVNLIVFVRGIKTLTAFRHNSGDRKRHPVDGEMPAGGVIGAKQLLGNAISQQHHAALANDIVAIEGVARDRRPVFNSKEIGLAANDSHGLCKITGPHAKGAGDGRRGRVDVVHFGLDRLVIGIGQGLHDSPRACAAAYRTASEAAEMVMTLVPRR